MLPERKLINRIRRRVGRGGLVRGIGDDCAILEIGSARQLLVTTDLCVEDVHFRRRWHPAPSIGHRCLARGLSDIAAMGGEPVASFLSLGLPPGLPQKWLDEFLRGFLRLAQKYKLPLAGGDTSSAEKIIADIVLLGTVPAGQAVLRSGASPGDCIYVTGALGQSAAVLKHLYSGEKVSGAAARSHFYPTPRLDVARELRLKKLTHAMIDLSDGLSVDLAHICEESRVSAIIDARSIPVAKKATLELALHGGEDYELLFTGSRKHALPAKIAGVPITMIGEIVPRASRGPLVKIRDRSGRTKPLEQRGWEHFAGI